MGATDTGTPATQERVNALAHEFARDAAEYDRTAAFPFANFERLREADLLSLTVPREFGGAGAGLAETCAVVRSVARGEPSTALVLAMQYIYHAVGRAAPWRADTYERMCRASVDGVALINVLRVEPELGTPGRGGLPATTAARTEGGWRLTGHKLYATGSPLLAYFLVWARTEGDEPQVGWFVVPREAAAWRIEETWDHIGMRATGSHDMVLEDVEIGEEWAIDVRAPAEWVPHDAVNACWNNMVIAALYHGIAEAAQVWLAGYLHERVPSNLGKPLASLPRHQSAVGEMEALLWANDRLLGQLAERIDTEGCDQEFARETATAKYVVTNNAIRAVEIGMGLVGNPGLSRHNPLERHHRDVLCGRVHFPQDDITLLMAGNAALSRGVER